jgi:3-hydroxybutyryl-CoA dehydrogenase
VPIIDAGGLPLEVLIVGAGTIASRVALACSLSGHRVEVLGRPGGSYARARGAVDDGFRELSAAGLLPGATEGWQQRLAFIEPGEGQIRAELAIEAVNEELALKQSVFEMLERRLPAHAILTSSTSGLPVDAIAARCTRPGRVAVMHFANPAHLMPAVELVPGTRTEAATMDALEAFVRGLGKRPIRLRRDIPGHIFNRIQFAMLREAMSLVRQGVASPADIDDVVKRGLALRLAEEGPLEKMDLAGLELVSSVATYLFPDLDSSPTPDAIDALIDQGHRGAASGQGFYAWDDRRIRDVLERRNAEVVRHLRRLAQNTD